MGLLLVLAHYPALVPEDLVEVAAGLQPVPPQEGPVRLLDEEVIAGQLPIDPQTDEIGQLRRHAGAPVELVRQRLGEAEPLVVLEEQVDGGHAPERLVLLEPHLVSAGPRAHRHEVEEVRLPGLRIDIDERAPPFGLRPRRRAPRREEGAVLLLPAPQVAVLRLTEDRLQLLAE